MSGGNHRLDEPEETPRDRRTRWLNLAVLILAVVSVVVLAAWVVVTRQWAFGVFGVTILVLIIWDELRRLGRL